MSYYVISYMFIYYQTGLCIVLNPDDPDHWLEGTLVVDPEFTWKKPTLQQ